MKNITRRFVIVLLAFIFICGFKTWIDTSPRANDYMWIHKRDTESDLARAFVTALRINHPAAYEMIDSNLKPRLDKWMSAHLGQNCIREADVFLSGLGNDGYSAIFGCRVKDRSLTFQVESIVINQMKVVDWGEVTEEFSNFP